MRETSRPHVEDKNSFLKCDSDSDVVVRRVRDGRVGEWRSLEKITEEMMASRARDDEEKRKWGIDDWLHGASYAQR